jgi:predicted AAA+ superfamily ATPase
MRLEDLLILLNEWWRTKSVSSDRLKEYKRDVFEELVGLLNYRQIIILSGLRRVGKSTLMFQLIDYILKNVSPERILYFSYDEKIEDIVSILNSFQKITGTDWKKSDIFVFLDEIQKLRDWGAKIKIIYDNFPRIKFIVSGSASMKMEKEALDNLAGRYFIVDVAPLSIKEYFELKNNVKIDKYELYRNDLKIELDNYFKKPFPEIVNWREERRIYEYVKESIISKILKMDLPDIFENVNTRLLMSLAEIFFTNPGMILNVDSLSKSLRIHKSTLERHIFLLEFSKLIRIVKNFRVSLVSGSRKLKKVYPIDVSLVFPFNPNIDKDKIFECAVASKINAEYYWREGNKEVDFIFKGNKIIPIEVKAKNMLDNNDLKSIQYFMKKFSVSEGLIVYEGDTKELKNGLRFVNILDFLYKDFFV